MEAAIKREQSHAMHELCRALAGSMGNIRKHQNIKEKVISLRNGRDFFILFAVEVEHFALFEIAFEVVVDVDGTYASGSACIEHIARLEGEELRDIGDDLVDTVEHVGGAAFLYGMAVDVEVEMKPLQPRIGTRRLRVAQQLLLRHPLADGGRTVETLANSPGLSSLRGTFLQVAGCEVDAHGQRIIVAVGKSLGDVLAQAADAHHDLRLVVDAPQVVRDKEGLSLIQDRRIGLGKDHRLVRALERAVELLIMCGIVHANSKYLHTTAKVQKKSALRKQCRFFFIITL